MTAASSHLLPPPVGAFQQPYHLAGSAFHRLFPLVLRRRPAEARGVIRSAGLVTRPAEVWAHGPVSSLTERLALQGWPLLSGSLFSRVRSCRQAVSGRVCVVVRAVSLICLRSIRPHLVEPCFRVTLTSSHGGLFKCGQKLPGNEQ